MYWNGKTIAITGATGFVGSWLAESLVKSGADVTILVRKDSPRGLDVIKNIRDKIKVIYGDIRDYAAVKKLIKNKQAVFHLAAITQVIYSKTHPVETFNIDANGTLNVLEAIRKTNDQSFLMFQSTDKVYGEPKYVPIDENCDLSSKSPYDAAKIAADRMVNAYFTSYGLNGTILRPSNIIGGRDANIWRVAPDFILSILRGKPPVIRGNGKHIRDYTYVEDVVEAIKLVVEKQNLSNGEVFNVGTGRPTSVLDLANLIIKIGGYKNKIKPKILCEETKGEIDKQFINPNKLQRLGWTPTFNLESGLRETMNWYKENRDWTNIVKRVEKFYSV